MSNSNEQRWQQRLENFNKSLVELENARNKKTFTNLERAGLIQLFEVSFELCWKTLKDLLFYEGFAKNSPRAVFKESFQNELLTEDETEILLDALSKRNVFTHTYDEQAIAESLKLIQNSYIPLLVRLANRLNEKSQ